MGISTGCAVAAKRTTNRLRRLAADNRGVAALEFALVAPLLLCMYFVTIEVSQAIETNKKAGRVASTVADLVTQQSTTIAVELDAILKIGKAILKPYERSDPKIVITAIKITDEETPKALVAWSRGTAGETPDCVALPAGTLAKVPEKLEIRGTFLVRVETCLGYEPVITWAADQQQTLGLDVMGRIFKEGVLKMKETYYLRPRMSQTIPCPDC